MFYKFFKIKNDAEGGEPGSIRYCQENLTAKVVRGDPEFVQWVIDHSPAGLRQRFTAGVINNRTELQPVVKCHMLDEFQELMLAGRHESGMPLCMIEHEDKNKFETHFIAPIFDLMFGKLVHPYIDRIDRHRYAAWVERFALIHGLEHADDHLRIRPEFEHLRLREVDKMFLTEIWEMVSEWVEDGTVSSREDLARKFTGTRHEVRFHTKNDKPLQQPIILGPDGYPLRLTNSIYYRPDFDPEGPKPLDRADDEAVKKRIKTLDEILRESMQFRAHHLIGRLFGRGEQAKVVKGKARSRLAELVAQKRERDLALDNAWKKLRVHDLFRSATDIKHGMPLPPFAPPMPQIESEVTRIQPAMSTEMQSSEKVSEVVSTHIDSQPSPPLIDAQPPVFQPEAQDKKTIVSSSDDALARADQAAAIAKKKRRKDKEQEMDKPSL